MPIDAAIPLQVKTPEPVSPLQTIGSLMQMRDMTSQIALRNAQTQMAQQNAADVAQQTAQRTRDNQSWNKLSDLMADPGVYKQVAGGDYSPIYGAGITANVASGATKNFDEMRKNAQGLKKGDVDLYLQNRGLVKDMLADAASEKDDDISAAQYNSGRDNLLSGPAGAVAKNLPVLQPGANYRRQLTDLINTNGFHTAILEDAANLAAKQSEASKNTAQAGEATAEAGLATAKTPGATAESQRQQLMTDLMKRAQTAQQNGQHPIDAILPTSMDQKAHDSYKATYDLAMANGGPEAANKVAEAAAAHAAGLAEKTNPQVIAAEAKKAAAVESATAPIKVNEQVQAEIQKAKLSPEAFGSVVNPTERMRAQAAYEKDSAEYADKVGAAAQLGDFVKAAQSGNKAAPGLIPITEVRQLVNRVNRQELEGVSSAAGSAFDRLQGVIGSLKEGEPIPPAVLKDITSISGVMQQAARRTYENKVLVTNSTYGSKAKPIDFESSGSAAAKTVSSALVHQYAVEHNIDDAAAKKVFTDKNYTVQ